MTVTTALDLIMKMKIMKMSGWDPQPIVILSLKDLVQVHLSWRNAILPSMKTEMMIFYRDFSFFNPIAQSVSNIVVDGWSVLSRR